jgi:UDP-N-acetylmuramoyl-tripeptide--D-alanyl-D-alanine ligase
MSDYLLQFSDAQKRGIQIIKYGMSNQHQVYASEWDYDQLGRPSFKINLPDNDNCRVLLKLSGQHSVLNSLAAAAIAHQLGVTAGDIQAGLEAAEPMSQRQEVIEHPSGSRLINDCYNANPDSMRAALQTFSLMSPERAHIAVLGDMLELGPQQTELHKNIGNLVAELKLDMLVTVGERADWIAQAAAESGLEKNRIHSFMNWQEAVELLQAELQSEPIILVKASRSMALERIIEALSRSS